MGISEIMDSWEILAIDHEPQGWPAVRMRELTEVRAHLMRQESRLAEADALRKDAAIGRAYMRWYAAAKGYKNVVVESAHKAIIDHAHLNPTTDTTEPT